VNSYVWVEHRGQRRKVVGVGFLSLGETRQANEKYIDVEVKKTYLRRDRETGEVVARVHELEDGTVVVEPVSDWSAYAHQFGDAQVLK
jgi:hypothetical protein